MKKVILIICLCSILNAQTTRNQIYYGNYWRSWLNSVLQFDSAATFEKGLISTNIPIDTASTLAKIIQLYGGTGITLNNNGLGKVTITATGIGTVAATPPVYVSTISGTSTISEHHAGLTDSGYINSSDYSNFTNKISQSDSTNIAWLNCANTFTQSQALVLGNIQHALLLENTWNTTGTNDTMLSLYDHNGAMSTAAPGITLSFLEDNSAGTKEEIGHITVALQNTTAGNEGSYYHFWNYLHGVFADRMALDTNADFLIGASSTIGNWYDKLQVTGGSAYFINTLDSTNIGGNTTYNQLYSIINIKLNSDAPTFTINAFQALAQTASNNTHNLGNLVASQVDAYNYGSGNITREMAGYSTTIAHHGTTNVHTMYLGDWQAEIDSGGTVGIIYGLNIRSPLIINNSYDTTYYQLYLGDPYNDTSSSGKIGTAWGIIQNGSNTINKLYGVSEFNQHVVVGSASTSGDSTLTVVGSAHATNLNATGIVSLGTNNAQNNGYWWTGTDTLFLGRKTSQNYELINNASGNYFLSTGAAQQIGTTDAQQTDIMYNNLVLMRFTSGGRVLGYAPSQHVVEWGWDSTARSAWGTTAVNTSYDQYIKNISLSPNIVGYANSAGTLGFVIDSNFNVTKVSAKTVEGIGILSTPDTVSWTSQSASISAVNFSNTSTGHLYRAIGIIYETTAGTSGTVSLTISYNDGAAQTYTTSNLTFGTLGADIQIDKCFYVNSGTPTWSTTVTSAVGSPVYAVKMDLVLLQ